MANPPAPEGGSGRLTPTACRSCSGAGTALPRGRRPVPGSGFPEAAKGRPRSRPLSGGSRGNAPLHDDGRCPLSEEVLGVPVGSVQKESQGGALSGRVRLAGSGQASRGQRDAFLRKVRPVKFARQVSSLEAPQETRQGCFIKFQTGQISSESQGLYVGPFFVCSFVFLSF